MEQKRISRFLYTILVCIIAMAMAITILPQAAAAASGEVAFTQELTGEMQLVAGDYVDVTIRMENTGSANLSTKSYIQFSATGDRELVAGTLKLNGAVVSEGTGTGQYSIKDILGEEEIQVKVGALAPGEVATLTYTFRMLEAQNLNNGCGYGTGSGSIEQISEYILKAPSYLVYDANGGTGSFRAPNVAEGGEDTVLSTDDTNIAREGYEFKGWNTQANGQGTSYKAGDKITLASGKNTLYAQWSKINKEPDNSGDKGNNTDDKDGDKGEQTPAPKPAETKPVQSPQTGDETNVLLFGILLSVSALGAVKFGKKSFFSK